MPHLKINGILDPMNTLVGVHEDIEINKLLTKIIKVIFRGFRLIGKQKIYRKN